ncbi:hypothetical protein J0383_04950 [Flavobacterium endoglycinae]|uniref:Lysine transporter LysE n=1 Tax=Flavobacterium endoglycinae TaxID=2816357 RepID=A0ABX7QGG4_9FLAO|nr:hypothetical protein [Flavobacterium endoglycinae]QSW90167.1 hypothetical protein J0383_04950 [Flavobacterium endoglycinae]
MKSLKNIGVGFIVSFLGSIPLGYLNLFGLEIYTKSGLQDLVFFLFGVIFVEIFVIFFTLIFARELLNNKKIMKLIDFFGAGFMFILAFTFHFNFNAKTGSDTFHDYLMYPPFIIGIVLNCFNFLQLPFWAGWNLYLLNGKYITIERKLKYYYILGTFTGVFSGMFTLIVLLKAVFHTTDLFSKPVTSGFISLVFMGLGVFQMYKIHKKYFTC